MMYCGLNNSASQVTEAERGVCGIQDDGLVLLLTSCSCRVFHVLLHEDVEEVGTAPLAESTLRGKKRVSPRQMTLLAHVQAPRNMTRLTNPITERKAVEVPNDARGKVCFLPRQGLFPLHPLLR